MNIFVKINFYSLFYSYNVTLYYINISLNTINNKY